MIDLGDALREDLKQFVDTHARARRIEREVMELNRAIETARRFVLPSTAVILKQLTTAADQVATAAAIDWRFGGRGNWLASTERSKRAMGLDFPKDWTDQVKAERPARELR